MLFCDVVGWPFWVLYALCGMRRHSLAAGTGDSHVAVIFAIGLVLAGEGINSAIERLSDVVQPERDDRIRDVKDISAGAVLICAITAAIIGIIVILPKLLILLIG